MGNGRTQPLFHGVIPTAQPNITERKVPTMTMLMSMRDFFARGFNTLTTPIKKASGNVKSTVGTVFDVPTTINESYSLKDSIKYMMPSSVTELVLYLILVFILILFIKLLEYTHIQTYIKTTSRCYRNAMLSNYSADTYVLKGYTMDNIEIVKITYKFKELDQTIDITAPKGTVLNKIKIPLYNLKTRETDEIERTFYSEIDYDLENEGMIYEGYPELVKFMQLSSTTFFEKKFEQMKNL